MSERMTKAARRAQLLHVMSSLYEQAKCRGDFTAERIAEAAGRISAVWVYRLVGAEYKELRSRLEGSHPSPGGNERKLRGEVVELRRRLRELEAKFKAEVTGDLSAAIRHIEAQDEQIRSLEGLVKALKSRLRAAGHEACVTQTSYTRINEPSEVPTDPSDSSDICGLSDILDATSDQIN